MEHISFVENNIFQLIDRNELSLFKSQLQSAIEASPEGTVLCLDMTGVKWVNRSGYEQIIGHALTLSHGLKDRFIFIQTEDNQYEHIFNMSPSSQEMKHPVMVRMIHSESKSNVVMIGELPNYLKTMLDLVYKSDACHAFITSALASKALSGSKKVCSTALTQLYDHRLIRRVKVTTANPKGYEFQYYPLFY